MRFDPQSNLVPKDAGFVPPSAAGAPDRGVLRIGARGALVLVGAVAILVGAWVFLLAGDMGPGLAGATFRPPAPTLAPRVVRDGEALGATAADEFATGAEEVADPAAMAEVAAAHERAARFERVFAQGREEVAAGHFAEGIVLLREAAALEPERADVRYKLALACVRAHAYDDARAEHETLAGLDPNLANLVENLIRARTGGLRAEARSRADADPH